MINYILYDDAVIRPHLLPFTFTRPVSEIRCGIMTLTEKWNHYLQQQLSYLTEPYLQSKYKLITSDDNIFINGAVCATENIVKAVQNLAIDQVLIADKNVIAYRSKHKAIDPISELKVIESSEKVILIQRVWDIFVENGNQIKADFEALTKNIPNSLNQYDFFRGFNNFQF